MICEQIATDILSGTAGILLGALLIKLFPDFFLDLSEHLIDWLFDRLGI